MSEAEAIREIYAQLAAPAWAAANLDGLLDVLRDLSWLPPGPVVVTAPENPRVLTALRQAAAETSDGPRPVVLRDPRPPTEHT